MHVKANRTSDRPRSSWSPIGWKAGLGSHSYEVLEERRVDRVAAMEQVNRQVDRVNRGDVYTGLVSR